MTGGVEAARLIGSDDVDSVEIRVDRVVVLEVVLELELEAVVVLEMVEMEEVEEVEEEVEEKADPSLFHPRVDWS